VKLRLFLSAGKEKNSSGKIFDFDQNSLAFLTVFRVYVTALELQHFVHSKTE